MLLASNMKLLTSYMRHYRILELISHGKQRLVIVAKLKQDNLDGNLYLIGGGDLR